MTAFGKLQQPVGRAALTPTLTYTASSPPHRLSAVDQRAERVGRSRVRVGIYSLAVDPLRPWMMLTGGTDPLLRLYDRRMLPDGDGKAPQWVSAYVPSHIKSSVLDNGRHPALAGDEAGALPGHAVTAVAFARGGAELVGSYSGECIYRCGSSLWAWGSRCARRAGLAVSWSAGAASRPGRRAQKVPLGRGWLPAHPPPPSNAAPSPAALTPCSMPGMWRHCCTSLSPC